MNILNYNQLNEAWWTVFHTIKEEVPNLLVGASFAEDKDFNPEKLEVHEAPIEIEMEHSSREIAHKFGRSDYDTETFPPYKALEYEFEGKTHKVLYSYCNAKPLLEQNGDDLTSTEEGNPVIFMGADIKFQIDCECYDDGEPDDACTENNHKCKEKDLKNLADAEATEATLYGETPDDGFDDDFDFDDNELLNEE
jgi:hypothetical protein